MKNDNNTKCDWLGINVPSIILNNELLIESYGERK